MNWVAFALLFLLFGCSQPSLVPMPGLTPALTKDSTPALSAANNGETQKAGSTLATANAGELHHILNANVLTREDAVQRSKQISQVSYTLWFGLSDDQTQFEGRTVVRFNFKNKSRDTFKRIALDFEGGSVHSIQCNGATLTDLSQPDRFDGHRIYFSTNELRPKSNQIEIAYSHPYSSNGEGLHRFIDPIDKKVYLYTQFEPYHAHQLFPCFDQPDLKATYELSVEAPQSWTVISNTLEREITPVDGRRSWSFPATKPLSTYLFALHAGPYASWKANANGIPLRLFSRKSLVSYIDSKEWLEITVKGLQFYHELFDFPYPFTKYDQIIVPDFVAGAMENAGAVTFSERFVFRTRVTKERREGRANTILHEMAHMWFGDLVTMRWWNGLWLNESFASFAAEWAVQEATRYSKGWQSFFGHMKEWAYWEDQLVTTHPVELPVPDTDHAMANFDGITYGKGASALKQLRFFLGEEDFKEGLRRYFQKYAYKNTSISDFIKTLAEASSKNLSEWQHLWLQTSGVNGLKIQWACTVDPETQKSTLSQFNLNQEGADLRPHRIQIALYSWPKQHAKEKASLVLSKTLNVSYSKASTDLPEALGQPCPAFVFPNYQDYDYVKVELDPVSLEVASQHLAQFQDPLVRQMLWHTLWEMVIDGKLQPQSYAQLVVAQGYQEKDPEVLSKILRTLASSSSHGSNVLKFLPDSQRKHAQAQMETSIRTHLTAAPAGTDLQLVWYQAFLEIAESQTSMQWLESLLNRHKRLPGLTMDPEHRWEIIQCLARNGSPATRNLIAAELSNDPTDMGQKAAIAAEASIPEPESKKIWFNRVTQEVPVGEKPLPPAKLRQAMGRYHLRGQETSTQASVDIYFKTVLKLGTSSSSEDTDYASWFTQMMFPSLCDPNLVQRTTELLDSSPNLPTPVLKSLMVHRQEEQRCIRIRQSAAQAIHP